MSYLNALKELTPNQRNVVVATFLGWTLTAGVVAALVAVVTACGQEAHGVKFGAVAGVPTGV